MASQRIQGKKRLARPAHLGDPSQWRGLGESTSRQHQERGRKRRAIRVLPHLLPVQLRAGRAYSQGRGTGTDGMSRGAAHFASASACASEIGICTLC